MDQKISTASQIRENRLKIKESLKMKLKKEEMMTSLLKYEPETQETACTRRRKKTSECLKQFDTMSIFKDISLKEQFEDLFVLKKKLGEGAHSVVYKCQEKKTQKEFAVKVTKRGDLQLMETMRQCYQILKQLNHEEIIKGHYLYMNEKKSICYLVEQLCQYNPLSFFIMEKRGKKTEKKGLDEKLVATICQSLLNCVEYLHEKGVCHRDIKPDNILYDPLTKEIKLIDFEIAKMERYTNQKLDLWSNTGTLQYKAPEIFEGGYHQTVDLWAIGVIAYEMLIGCYPFKCEHYGDAVKEICHKELDFESLPISKNAQLFLSRLLEKNPEKRMTAKEALSSVFIMKNKKHYLSKLQRLKSLRVSTEASVEDEPHHFYDESTKTRYEKTISSDIGVRICGDSND